MVGRMQRRFVGKVVVVTGASAGIGAECARLFAAEGAELVLAARRAEPLEALATELRKSSSARVVVVPADVGRIEDCRRLVERTVDELGSLHVLVNNAGAHFRGPVESRTPEELAEMVDVNTRAPIVLSRLAIPHLREAAGGAIVNVASLAGMVPLRDAATYSATKFALRAFSRALADELRDARITVSLVSPGPVIDTGFLMGSGLEDAADIVFAQPMSTAREVAELVVLCAHDGRVERVKPRSSAAIATVANLVPLVRRAFEPVMRRRGKKVKERYLRERRAGE
jgi:short-subunit dehydrogenase